MKHRADRIRTAARIPASVLARPRGQWLSGVAVAIALAVVIGRLLMTESVRSAIAVSPGSQLVPYAPGPASGLLLDLLAGLCPILVLLQRQLDPGFFFKRGLSAWLFIGIAIWAVCSTIWANDRFAAMVSACHLLAAVGVCWSLAQAINSWRDLRLGVGIAAGLLLVLAAQGAWYDRIERVDLIKEWNEHRELILKTRNIQPGTFDYIQFENKILHGELMGFSVSPNTYAALMVLLGCMCLGGVVQAVKDRRPILVIAPSLAIIAAGFVLPLTQSRTANSTSAMGVFLILCLIPMGGFLKRRATLLYVLGVAAVVGGAAYLIGFGLSRGTLFQDSLNFRWRYWVGSFNLWRLHPLLGVGWENFGASYLGVRVPEATEEIKDPHNFAVRFFVELGAIGGTLALAWVARLWWELTRPSVPAADIVPDDAQRGFFVGGEDAARQVQPAAGVVPAHTRPGRPPLGVVATIAAGIVLTTLCGIDFTQDSSFVLVEVVRRCIFLLLLLGGALGALHWRQNRETSRWEFSTEPAPLMLLGTLVGLGMFFIHNLIDFSLFEVGPLFLFAMISGGLIGLRTPRPLTGTARGRRAVRIALPVLGAIWLIGGLLVVLPIVSAEALAREADDSLRLGRPDIAGRDYESAFANAIANADYARRAAEAWIYANDPARARVMLDQAIVADPGSPSLRAMRADLVMSLQPKDLHPAADDLRDAVALDPNSAPTRIRYAEILEKMGLSQQAAEQYRITLELNDRLTREERKRLPETTVMTLQKKIEQLLGTK